MIKAQGGIFGWVSHSIHVHAALKKIHQRNKPQPSKKTRR
jgi:hypothetical protein